MPADKRYYYGRITVHPVFVDELQVRGVQFARNIDAVSPDDAQVEGISVMARYPESAAAAVEELAACSGGAVVLETCLVDHETDLGDHTRGFTASRPIALASFHEYGAEAAASDSERLHHHRALERLRASWGRSIRHVEAKLEGTSVADPDLPA